MFILLINCPFDDAKVRRFCPDSKNLGEIFSELLRQGGNETTKGGLRAESCRETRKMVRR